MPKNEDGEFELILGNRQLLSVFFIVVVLLGVFFTMGYIVGRNSPLAAPEASAKNTAAPLVVGSPAPSASNPGKEETAKESIPVAAPTETAPQQPEPEKPSVVKHEPAKPVAAKPAPVREKPQPKPVEKAEEHSSGTYLQLAATTQREADIEVDVLRKKGFRAMAAEIPEKPGMFRVLVGPVAEGSVNKMKTDLQNAGFPGDKAIRRTM